ncbi:MAG: AAA family ATPase [Candidatus Kariarchaeaceae archaeon]|jgi:DNA repair exonuclease SbcCD ATPase subunit
MISRLRLKNFRRFQDASISFDNGISYIEGKNNAGKSSLFMGIEYGLFGTVAGFRSQTALFAPQADKMGVEVIYEGKDGRTYRLQRMHERAGRSAKGHYTLKVKDGDTEKYLVSSDFEGSSEEMLQLQVFESLGISKRLFDVAVNIKQGEISSILEGTSQLDIVLGVSAATIAQKQLNAVALGFEKETSQYDLLANNLKQFENQRQQLELQSKSLGTEVETLQKQFDGLTSQKSEMTAKIDQFQQVLTPFSSYKSTIGNWDRDMQRIVDHTSQKEEVIKEAGDLPTLLKTLEERQEKVRGLTQQISKSEEERKKLQDSIRTQERKKGDVVGKVNRRKNLPEGEEPTCEECGSPIDMDRVKKELAQWELDLGDIELEIKKLEEQVASLSSEISTTRQEVQQTNQSISRAENLSRQLETLQGRENQLMKTFSETGELLMDQAVEIYESLQEYNETLDAEMRLKTTKPSVPETVNVDVEGDVLQARYMVDVFTPLFGGEQNRLNSERDTISVELRVQESKLRDKQTQLKNLKPGLEKLNLDISKTKGALSLLEKKRTAAQEMRTSAKVFKTLQEILRDRAASNLGTMTLRYHKELSETNNILDLRVDPKQYAIFVKPDDVGEEVPAFSYQGGGHKLLLGLAFKLAIVSFVTNPPFILLDEPTYGLDSGNKSNLFEKIGNLTKSQILLITHQRQADTGGTLFEIKKNGPVSTVEVVS